MDGDRQSSVIEATASLVSGKVPIASALGLTAKELAHMLSRATSLMKVGRDSEAADLLQGLVALDHTNPVFREYLGMAHERLGALNDAVEEYSVNIELLEAQKGHLTDADARLAEGYVLRAAARLIAGEVEDCLDDLEQSKSHGADKDPELARELNVLEQAANRGEA